MLIAVGAAAGHRLVGRAGRLDARRLLPRLHVGGVTWIDELDHRRAGASHRAARAAGAARGAARAHPARAGALGLAPAHLDADRADPALPAGARRGARVGRAAGGRRLGACLAVARAAPDADADLREARPLLRLRLGVVLGHLHPADGLAGRLHHPAAARLLARRTGPAAAGAAQPRPAARERVLRDRRGARGRARGGPRRPAPAPLPRRPARGIGQRRARAPRARPATCSSTSRC